MLLGLLVVLAAQPLQVVAERAALGLPGRAAAGDRGVVLEDVGENLAEAPAVEDEVVAGPGEQDAVAAGPGDDQPEQRGAGEVQAGGAVGGQYLAQPFVPVGLGQ